MQDGISEFVVDETEIVEIKSEAPKSLGDKWTLDSVLKRNHLIGTLTINGTEVFNANLLGANFDPFSKLLARAMVVSVLSPYMYWRGGCEVMITTTPPGACLGAMCFSVIPEGAQFDVDTPFADNNTVDCLATAFNGDFGIVDFSNPKTIVFKLPFLHRSNYEYITSSIKPMYRLQAQSMAALTSTVGTAAAATINIYAKFADDFEVFVPKLQMKKAPSAPKKSFDQARDDINGRVKKAIGGKISDVASKVASTAATVAGTIPMLAPFATPLAAGAQAISSVASFFGFTRETSYEIPTSTVQRFAPYLTLTDGVDTGEKIALTQGAAVSIDPRTLGGTGEDPAAFESIRRRWGMVAAFTLDTTTTPGASIYNLPVTPGFGNNVLGSLFLTPGGYYGAPFERWRGSMEYMIYIPSSPNMRGMLQVVYNPSVRNTLPPYAMNDPTNSAHTVSLDLSQTQQHLIIVKYASPTPTLNNMLSGTATRPTGTPFDASNCNGSIDFYLSNAWVAPRVGTVGTRVIILARPGPDMVFACPRKCWFTTTGNEQLFQATYQMKAVDPTVEMLESTLVDGGMSDFNIAQTTVSETAPSARALMQKFSPMINGGAVVGPTSGTSGRINISDFPCAAGNCTVQWSDLQSVGPNFVIPWTWLGHYAMLFVGVRGGQRLKIATTDIMQEDKRADGTLVSIGNSARHFVCFHSTTHAQQMGVGYDMSSNLYHGSLQAASTANVCEVTYPYESDFLYINPRTLNSTSLTDPGFPLTSKMGFFCANTTMSGLEFAGTFHIQVLYAGADDISVGPFRRVPRLVAATVQV